jgi:hypothetical protein
VERNLHPFFIWDRRVGLPRLVSILPRSLGCGLQKAQTCARDDVYFCSSPRTENAIQEGGLKPALQSEFAYEDVDRKCNRKARPKRGEDRRNRELVGPAEEDAAGGVPCAYGHEQDQVAFVEALLFYGIA